MVSSRVSVWQGIASWAAGWLWRTRFGRPRWSRLFRRILGWAILVGGAAVAADRLGVALERPRDRQWWFDRCSRISGPSAESLAHLRINRTFGWYVPGTLSGRRWTRANVLSPDCSTRSRDLCDYRVDSSARRRRDRTDYSGVALGGAFHRSAPCIRRRYPVLAVNPRAADANFPFTIIVQRPSWIDRPPPKSNRRRFPFHVRSTTKKPRNRLRRSICLLSTCWKIRCRYLSNIRNKSCVDMAALLEKACADFGLNVKVVGHSHRPGHHAVRNQPRNWLARFQDHVPVGRPCSSFESAKRAHRRADSGQEHGRHRGAERTSRRRAPEGTDDHRLAEDSRR